MKNVKHCQYNIFTSSVWKLRIFGRPRSKHSTTRGFADLRMLGPSPRIKVSGRREVSQKLKMLLTEPWLLIIHLTINIQFAYSHLVTAPYTQSCTLRYRFASYWPKQCSQCECRRRITWGIELIDISREHRDTFRSYYGIDGTVEYFVVSVSARH